MLETWGALIFVVNRRNPHWGSIKWPHANRVCAQLWRDALQLGAVQCTPNKNLQIFLHKHIFNLEFNNHSGLCKRHLLEMDLGELTIYIYVCSYHLSSTIFPKLPIQKSFPRTFRSSMDAPSSFVLPCHCPPVGNSKFRQNSSNSISDWSDHLTTLYLLYWTEGHIETPKYWDER